MLDWSDTTPAPVRAATTPVKLAFVGAGNYATSMLLPHLAQREGVELSTVVTTTSLSGANAQRNPESRAGTSPI